MTEHDKPLSEDNALEGPDIEVPTHDPEGTTKPDGLGEDGTIPNQAESPQDTPARRQRSSPKKTNTPNRHPTHARVETNVRARPSRGIPDRGERDDTAPGDRMEPIENRP